MKSEANEIFGIFEKFKNGQCSYDRALEDASKVIDKLMDERPIIGYIKSGKLKRVLDEVIWNKLPNTEKTYIFDCKIHQNEMSTLEEIYKLLK